MFPRLFLVPVLAAALLAAAPASADECSDQIRAVTKLLAAHPNLSPDQRQQVEELLAEAKDAQAEKDVEGCVAVLEEARAALQAD